MPNEFAGKPAASPEDRFAIIVSTYNDNITGNLKSGAVYTLVKAGVAPDSIDIYTVPGAWELSLVAERVASLNEHASIICLGAVIRGETTHDEHINRQVSLSLGQISLNYSVPIQFGLLTCNSLEQAIHRSGGNVGNKGEECADAALEMASLLKQIPAAES